MDYIYAKNSNRTRGKTKGLKSYQSLWDDQRDSIGVKTMYKGIYSSIVFNSKKTGNNSNT